MKKIIIAAYKYGANIEQKNNGIYYTKINKNGDNQSTKICDGIITSITNQIDMLGLNEEQYKLTFLKYRLDSSKNKEISIIGESSKDLANQLSNYCAGLRNESDLEKLIAAIIHSNYLEEEFYYSIDGYFLHEGRIINNNTYLNELYNDKTDLELKELLQIANSDLEEFLNLNHDNYKTLAILLLLSPFNYLFKQLGLQHPIKIPYLFGRAKSGKTTNILYLLSMYLKKNIAEAPCESKASLSNCLNETITYSRVVDEAHNILNAAGAQEYLKRSVYSINARRIANTDKQGHNVNYRAYNLPVLIANRDSKFFEGLGRRFVGFEFKKPIQNNKHYRFNNDNTELSILGYLFANEFIDNFKSLSFNSPEDVFNSVFTVLEFIDEKYNCNFVEVLATDVNPWDLQVEEADIIDMILENIKRDINKNHLKYSDVDDILSTLDKFTAKFKYCGNNYYSVNINKFNNIIKAYSNGNVFTIEELFGVNPVKINSAKELSGEDDIYITNNMIKKYNTVVSENALIIKESMLKYLFGINHIDYTEEFTVENIKQQQLT